MIKKKIKTFAKNKFFQGGIFLTISTFLVGFLNYLFNSLSGKALGPTGYSEIAALFSYLGIVLIPMQVIGTDLIRRLGEKGEDRVVIAKIWERWFWQKLYRWRYIFIPYLFLLIPLPALTNLSLLFSFTLLLSIPLSLIATFYLGALQGLHMFFIYSTIVTFATLTKTIGPILVFLKIGGAPLIAFSLLFSSFILFAASKLYLLKSFNKIKSTKTKIDKRILSLIFNKKIALITFSILGINLLNNLDVIFVKKFFTAQDAGIYGAWSLFAKIILYILGPITSLSFIYFSARENKKKHLLALVIFVLITTSVGVGMFVFYSLFGRESIHFIFSDKYLSLLPNMSKAAIFGLLFTLILIINSYFLAYNSKLTLISLGFAPIYILLLISLAKNIETVMNINIIVCLLIFLTYLSAVGVRSLKISLIDNANVD